ncbi:homoserine O-acetyltransferase/O-succinyltransferase family protein [Desnuesiella massiliensis]|uniref:homoserine O-acetyltransferase/O-succinyltransferase family protein n=1 Tax=Desnuesiella massiliensis TaxID=1650662 RepID=UPI0006E293A1|nr:homoserine O-succinyltransferase [Desnuesiella massiliensis]
MGVVIKKPSANYQSREEAVYKIAILNLMPNKQDTEKQLVEMLQYEGRNIEIYFLKLDTYNSQNTSKKYLEENYYGLEQLRNISIDGIIITGAPVEKLAFEEVIYWKELKVMFDYMKQNIKTAIFICWGAQAALYHYYYIDKNLESNKIFGLYKHHISYRKCLLLKGLEEGFWAPHSRCTNIDLGSIGRCGYLDLISFSEEAGPYIIKDKKDYFFILGHGEYAKDTLKEEYFRDIEKGLKIDIPKNYFLEDNPLGEVKYNWKDDAKTMYENWLKYYVFKDKEE